VIYVSCVMASCVYFLQCGDDGPIKIGYSRGGNAEGRLTVAQVYNPFLLHLLCVMPGGRRVELELHNKFDQFRISGEWFEPNRGLLDLIQTLPPINLTTMDFRRSGAAFDSHHNWKGKYWPQKNNCPSYVSSIVPYKELI